MGLLSSRTFRQIATGALQGVEDKRNEMRDRIDTYRERAVNKKSEIQKKYNEYYDEEKANIDTFKQVASLVGDDYVGKLNSFVGTDPNRLSMLLQQDANVVRTELDKYKDTTDTSFVEDRQQKLKLKEEELAQNLQDQVNLFKGTSSIFTRDIEQRGLKEIQAETGTIDTQTIDPKFQAGPGMNVKTKLDDQEKINVISNFDKLYKNVDTGDGFDYKRNDDNPEKYDNSYVQSVFDKVAIMEANAAAEGVTLDTQTALAEVLYQANNQTYKGDNLKFITQVGPDSPALNKKEFDDFLFDGNLEEARKIAEQNKTLNIFIAEDQLNEIKEAESQLESGEETTTTTTDLTKDVTARPEDPAPYQKGTSDGDAIISKQTEWDTKYGNTHFDDGILMSPTQQEAWKQSQANPDKFDRPKRSKKNIQLYVK